MNGGERGLSTLDRAVIIGASLLWLGLYALWKRCLSADV